MLGAVGPSLLDRADVKAQRCLRAASLSRELTSLGAVCPTWESFAQSARLVYTTFTFSLLGTVLKMTGGDVRELRVRVGTASTSHHEPRRTVALFGGENSVGLHPRVVGWEGTCGHARARALVGECSFP